MSIPKSIALLASVAALMAPAIPVIAAGPDNQQFRDREQCRTERGPCSPGRCGKRRGDWYGARRPVSTPEEARELLRHHFSGDGNSIANLAERRWRYEADIIDPRGSVIDRVMIDKRSGRIRSIF